jgi:hypothetical protein
MTTKISLTTANNSQTDFLYVTLKKMHTNVTDYDH